jgi:hypothetical protein
MELYGDSNLIPLDRFASAVSSVQLPILDNVDANFALALRRDGRLEPFRKALYELWSKSDASSEDKSNFFQKTFSDHINQALREAKADWDDIDRQLLAWSAPAAATAIASGAFTLVAPAVTFLIGAITMLVVSRWKRYSFRQKNPLSVLLDLTSR